MCIVSDTLVNKKTFLPATQMGEWNDGTISALREMWADGLGGAEIGRRLGFSKGAIHGKVDRLELPNRERISTGNAIIAPELIERIKRLHHAGKTIMQIHAELGCISKDRIARVIGPQGKRNRIKVNKKVNKYVAPTTRVPRPSVVNLHTLEETDDIFAAITEAKRYLTKKHPALAPLQPKSPRQCLSFDGPRYKQVQCDGVIEDLRSPYCPECKAQFHLPRAA